MNETLARPSILTKTNPVELQVDWATATAALVQYEMSDVAGLAGNILEVDFENDTINGGGVGVGVGVGTGSAARKEKKGGKRKWDNAILSNFCRWRACLSCATPRTTPKYLCNLHTNLKHYLDSSRPLNSTLSSESSKYLPKKPPFHASGKTPSDLHMIKAASSLLQGERAERGGVEEDEHANQRVKRAASESSSKRIEQQANRAANEASSKRSELVTTSVGVAGSLRSQALTKTSIRERRRATCI